jgi:hypothetical protein
LDQDRCVGDRGDEPLHAGTDTVLGGSAARGRCRSDGAGEVEQVHVFGFVEPQPSGERVEHALRDAAEVAALHLGVVVHAHPGEHCRFFAPQPRNPPVVAEHRQASPESAGIEDP